MQAAQIPSGAWKDGWAGTSEVGGGDRSTGPRRNCGVAVCSELRCGPRTASHHQGVALSLCARLLRLQGPLLPPCPRSSRHTALLGCCAVGSAYLPVAHRCPGGDFCARLCACVPGCTALDCKEAGFPRPRGGWLAPPGEGICCFQLAHVH